MTSLTPAPVTSTGLPRRVTAVVVATGLLLAGAAPQNAWHVAAVLLALAAAAVALASEQRWRLLVKGARPSRGRHRAVALPRQRRAAAPSLTSVVTSTVETVAQGGAR